MKDLPAWQENALWTEYASLRGRRRTDVVIVGGGFTGLTLAADLAAHGVKTIVLEAKQLLHGASMACMGIVTAQVQGCYETIAGYAGDDAARSYARWMQRCVREVGNTCRRRNYQCGLAATEVCLHERSRREAERWRGALALEERLQLPFVPMEDAGGCPVPVLSSIALPGQWMLSPLAYGQVLARDAARHGAGIYEHSPVTAIDNRSVYTPEGSVQAEAVVLATGIPAGLKATVTLARMEQRMGVMYTLHGGAPAYGTHVMLSGVSYRAIPGGELARCDAGHVGSRRQETACRQAEGRIRRVMGDWQIENALMRQEVWSRDGLPLIGRVDPSNDWLLMATGYNGWGVAGAKLAADLLCAQLLDYPERDAAWFSPARKAQKAVAKGMAAQGAAYLAGAFHPGTPKCPHMGCRMRYDEMQRQWCCPCHGSSFTVLGECVTAPAMEHARISRRQRTDR